MALDPFDRQIQDGLNKGTEASTQMKEEIWQNIRRAIDSERIEKAKEAPAFKRSNRTRTRSRLTYAASTLAAVLLIFVIAPAKPTQALINQIKEWFAPQKVVEERLEGIPSKSQVTLHQGASNYVVYFDEDIYRMEQAGGKDRIVPKEKPGDIYPEVYMEISQQQASPEKVAAELHSQLKDYPTLLDVREVEEPRHAWEVYAVGGTGGQAWNDEVVRFHVFDNEQGGSFVVKQQYFLEAEEGHGDRFKQILKEFHITEINNESGDNQP